MGTVIIIPADPEKEIYQATHPETSEGSSPFLRRHIECSRFDCVELTHGIDMWIDDEGLFTQPVNERASALTRSLNPRTQPYYGNVVITGVNVMNGATRNLKEGQRDWVLGQLVKSMLPAQAV